VVKKFLADLADSADFKKNLTIILIFAKFYRKVRKVFSQSSRSFRAENFRRSAQSYPSNHFIPVAYPK